MSIIVAYRSPILLTMTDGRFPEISEVASTCFVCRKAQQFGQLRPQAAGMMESATIESEADHS